MRKVLLLWTPYLIIPDKENSLENLQILAVCPLMFFEQLPMEQCTKPENPIQTQSNIDEISWTRSWS